MKMALQISIVETAANQENRCSALQASVYSAKSPTTFVDGVSSGKSRIIEKKTHSLHFTKRVKVWHT